MYWKSTRDYSRHGVCAFTGIVVHGIVGPGLEKPCVLFLRSRPRTPALPRAAATGRSHLPPCSPLTRRSALRRSAAPRSRVPIPFPAACPGARCATCPTSRSAIADEVPVRLPGQEGVVGVRRDLVWQRREVLAVRPDEYTQQRRKIAQKKYTGLFQTRG